MAPQTLTIPRIGVQSAVEQTPLIKPQDYTAPFRWEDTAWFSRGPRPGERGHAVVFGHLDSYCCAAVFWNLHLLGPGDIIQVQYRSGRPLRFATVWTRSFADGPALTKWVIYHKTRERDLLLVTCAGVFHGEALGYDHRLVVFARLISGRGFSS